MTNTRNPIAEARELQQKIEKGWSRLKLARCMGVCYTVVNRRVKLLELPDSVKADIEAGRINETQGLVMLRCLGKPDLMTEAHRRVLEGYSNGRLSDWLDRVEKGLPEPKPKKGKVVKVTAKFLAYLIDRCERLGDTRLAGGEWCDDCPYQPECVEVYEEI